jgi:hypothetical protein
LAVAFSPFIVRLERKLSMLSATVKTMYQSDAKPGVSAAEMGLRVGTCARSRVPRVRSRELQVLPY